MAKTQDDSEQDEYESYEDKSCQVSLIENDYQVNKTGNTQTISGVPTQVYTLTWTIRFEDDKGKKRY